jgi:hypothetical protein
MPNKEGHRRFGSVRKRESGRYQARYPGPDGRMRSAAETFARRSDAERYLSLVEAQIVRGEWTDPDRGKRLLQDYAEDWIAQRPGLRPRTIELYRWLLKRHITPHLGNVPIGKLNTPMIRAWRAKLLADGISPTMAAKAYRVLRAILMTAVHEDKILTANPCQVKGAGSEHAPERPVLSVVQVFDLASRIGIRPIGNIRMQDQTYRLRYQAKSGPMRTHPTRFSSRAEAERTLWRLLVQDKAEGKHDPPVPRPGAARHIR